MKAKVFWDSGCRAFLAAFLMCATLLAISNAYAAPPALVKAIGKSTTVATGTTLSVTVPAAGVAAGNSIIVGFAMTGIAGTVTCSDSAGNTYAVDADVRNSVVKTSRAVICSAHNVSPLVAGNTITVTSPSSGTRAVSAIEFSGLIASGTVDKTSTATGNNGAPNSGTTAATTVNNEVVFGINAMSYSVNETFTAAAGFTLIGEAGVSGFGSSPYDMVLNPGYRIVANTGTYAFSGTNSNNRPWAAAVVTYKGTDLSDASTCGPVPNTYPLYGGSGFTTENDWKMNGSAKQPKVTAVPFRTAVDQAAVVTNTAVTMRPIGLPFAPSTAPAGTNTSTSIAAGHYDKITKPVGNATTFTGGTYFINVLGNVSSDVSDWTITMAPGDYYIDKIDLHDQNSIVLSGTGVVRIYVKTSIDVHNEWTLNNGGTTRNLQIFLYPGATAIFNDKTILNGLIYAPGNTSTISFHNTDSSHPITGAIITGGTLDFSGGQEEVFYNAATQSAIGLISTCGTVNISGSTVVASPTSVTADNTTTSTITVTLKDDAGNPIIGKTVTLAAGSGSSTISAASGPSDVNGVVTFTVKNAVAQAVTYTATDVTDGLTIAQTATVTFTQPVARFNVVEPGANAVTGKIFTKIAGQDFAFDIVALDASNNVVTSFAGEVVVEVIDFSPGNCDVGKVPVAMILANQTFEASDAGRHALTATNTVPDAYAIAKVRVRYPVTAPTITSCSSDTFAVRPASLSFLVQDANRTTEGVTRTLNNTVIPGGTCPGGASPCVHNAGRPFRITATAYNAAGTPEITPNYNGTPTAIVTACAGTACPLTPGNVSLGAWSASAGTVMTTTATYDDVGAFNLRLQDTTFATATSGDGSDGTPVLQYTIPSTATGVGRFVPDRFVLSAVSMTPRSDIAACSASSFTYMGEPMQANFTLTAVKFPSGTTPGYGGSLAQLNVNSVGSFNFAAIDSAAPTALTARLTTSIGTPTPSWGAGVASNIPIVVSLNRNATPDGPYVSFKLGIAPSDADLVALDPAALNLDADNSGSNESVQIGSTTAVRFGRLRLQNANGSNLISMPIPISAQYWNGSGFVTNTLDNCTTVSNSDIALGNYQVNLGSGETTVSGGGTLTAGVATLRLSAPGAGNNGSVDVSVNLTSGTAGASCTTGMPASTAGNKSYLQGLWCAPPGTYARDPTARASFGIFRNSDQFIYRRENY